MKRNTISVIVQVFAIIALLYLALNPEFLVPAGYELGVDGLVVSRNLCIVSALVLIYRFGEQNCPTDL